MSPMGSKHAAHAPCIASLLTPRQLRVVLLPMLYAHAADTWTDLLLSQRLNSTQPCHVSRKVLEFRTDVVRSAPTYLASNWAAISAGEYATAKSRGGLADKPREEHKSGHPRKLNPTSNALDFHPKLHHVTRTSSSLWRTRHFVTFRHCTAQGLSQCRPHVSAAEFRCTRALPGTVLVHRDRRYTTRGNLLRQCRDRGRDRACAPPPGATLEFAICATGGSAHGPLAHPSEQAAIVNRLPAMYGLATADRVRHTVS